MMGRGDSLEHNAMSLRSFRSGVALGAVLLASAAFGASREANW